MPNPPDEVNPAQPSPDPLADWGAAAGRALGLAPDLAGTQQGRLLAVAREVAHTVARPAAPISTFLIGVAVGRGADPEQAAATLEQLAKRWPAREDPAATGD